MALAPGDRFGSYVVVGSIGAGGMGEVYRAHDSRLRRDVALKVLPDAVRLEPGRLARFEQEARALAVLNHPGIAAIYGVEEGPPAAGHPIQALVLELVEGGTLATRLARGPIPVPEALSIARQIAEALEAAHSKGIVHRDLKPANVAMTSDGIVKVLDFGLAKIATETLAADETKTLGATHEGMVVGTAAYMSPEQARGQAVDKRTDIWAFGCVLYEMLTGQRLFQGDRTTDTLALLLTKDPDWSALPPRVPPAARALLKRCLERDQRKRLGDVAAIRFVLEDVSELDATTLHGSAGAANRPRRQAWTRTAAVAVSALLVGGLLVGLYNWTREPAEPRVVRLSMSQPGRSVLTVSSTFDDGATPDLAFSPDGLQVAYVGNNGTKLYVRSLDSLEPREVATGYQLRNPFFSPRGDWIGYADRRYVIKKVAITGGPSIPIPARLDTDLAGATWLPNDTIVFATFGGGRGLRRAPATAGAPVENETLTRPDPEKGEVSHLWPHALPGGQAVLFTITYRTGGLGRAQVWVLDLRTRSTKQLLVGGSDARFMPGAAGATRGHLVFAAEGGLRAIAFDAARLTTIGTAVPVVSQVATSERGAADFAVASDGALAYVNASDPGPATLTWVDPQGREEPITAPPGRYGWVRVAPDGTRLALGSSDPEIGIWDIRRATLTPLRFASTERPNGPVWTADSGRIVVQAGLPNQRANLWWAAADGSDTPERLTTSSNTQRPTGATVTHVLLMEAAPDSLNVMQVALDRTRKVTGLIQEPASWDALGVVSPDERWLAYESDVTGRMEIHVCPYPDVIGRCVQVSTMGGTAPRWLPRTGGALFFASPDGSLMRMSVDSTSRSWQAGTPTKVVELQGLSGSGSSSGMYDIAPDGRVVMIKRPTASPEVAVVLHWNQELARLAPAK